MAPEKKTKVEILEEAGVLDVTSLTSYEKQRLNQLTDGDVEAIVSLRRKLGDRFRLFCRDHG